MTARLSLVSDPMTAEDWARAKAEHRHGAWCHPAAEGCPDLMAPMTPPVGVTRGSRTPVRRAQPPHITDGRVIAALTATWALLAGAWQLL